MAVTFCNISDEFAGGSYSGTSLENLKGEYEVEYVFKVNSDRDGPATILAYCTPNSDVRPFLGKEYSGGNDVDPVAICTSISIPKRKKGAHRLWHVTAKYTTRTGNDDEPRQEPGPDGKNTTDPTLWIPKVTIKSTQINIPVEEALYLGGFLGSAKAVCPANTKGCVTNSAFVEYNPPLERELTMKIYTFTQYFGAWLGPTYDQYDDAINDDLVVFAGNAAHFSATWDPYKARIKNFDGSNEWVNGKVVWTRTVEVHVHPLGWDRHIPDRGLLRRADPRLGDPDGRGGTLSSSDTLPAGYPPVRQIVGWDEVPITEPVLFNGDGQPLPNPSPGTAVYLDYRTYLNTRPFAPLNLVG